MKTKLILTVLMTFVIASINLSAAPKEDDLVQSPEGGIFVIREGQRCLIPNMEIFNENEFKMEKVVKISNDELKGIPEGPAVFAPIKPYKTAKEGDLIRGSGQGIYVIRNELRYLIPDMEVFNACGFDVLKVIRISDEDLVEIPAASSPWKVGM